VTTRRGEAPPPGAGWAKVRGGLNEDTRADVVRQSSLVIAMLCDREAEPRGITRDQFLAQFRAAMDRLGCPRLCGRGVELPRPKAPDPEDAGAPSRPG
jgi:hypothetical protein